MALLRNKSTCAASLRYQASHPWVRNLNGARSRCNNPRRDNYKRYGGKGIKCLLTNSEAETLWLRDGASEMKRPSLDRINNNGHYELSNCRFMELADNQARATRTRKACPSGHEYTKENSYTNSSGHRRCRECKRIENSTYYRRRTKSVLP